MEISTVGKSVSARRLAVGGAGVAALLVAAQLLTPTDPRTYPRAVVAPTLGPVYTYDWDDTAGGDVSYGGSALGISEDGQYLYIACNVVNSKRGIAKFRIPTDGTTRLQVVEGCKGPTAADIKQIHPDPAAYSPQIGGILEQGGRVVVAGVITYDAGGTTAKSHWMGPDLAHLAGPFAGTTAPGLVKGGMGVIPTEWRSLLGGSAFAVSGYDSIASRQSYVPSFTAFNPADITRDGFPMTTLAACRHNDPGCNTYQFWGPATTSYEGSELEGGAFIMPGTRTLIHIEREGLGTPAPGTTSPNMCAYGYATRDPSLHGQQEPGPDNALWSYSLSDPLGEKGPKCWPYRLVAKQTDLLDMLAVKAGTKKDYEVRPYAQTVLPSGLSNPNSQNLLAGAFDPNTGRLYMVYDAHGGVNEIHTLDFGTVTTPPPSATDCIPGTESMVSDDSATASCVLQPDGTGVKTITEQWTRTGDVPETNGGLACAPVATPRQRVESCVPTPPPSVDKFVVSLTVATCVARAADDPPDTSGGWGVQFTLDGANLGTRATNAPFSRSRSGVAAGSHTFVATWTKSGAAPVVRTPKVGSCG